MQDRCGGKLPNNECDVKAAPKAVAKPDDSVSAEKSVETPAAETEKKEEVE